MSSFFGKVFTVLAILALLPQPATSAPMENCEGFLQANFASAPLAGYVRVTVLVKQTYKKGQRFEGNKLQALRLKLALLDKIDSVLVEHQLRTKVKLVDDFDLSYDPRALELLRKGLDLETIEEFFPKWNSVPRMSGREWRDIRDPDYQAVESLYSGSVDLQNFWVEQGSLVQVIELLNRRVPEGEFLDYSLVFGGIKPI